MTTSTRRTVRTRSPNTPKTPARAPTGRASSARQRLRLINACISALHIHGPSRTTVAKVVAIAGMSPGIVRFYFASKASMLVASLEYLAAEFEQHVLVPVAQLRRDPVQGLAALVDLYLDPEISSPRKVSVWYSFWGEASSRQEYFDICGNKDQRFAELVRELVGRLIAQGRATHLDADAVALGLIGVLEMLWQDIAFQTEARIDRSEARRRALAYLRSVFPQHFAAVTRLGEEAGYWQIAEHECALPSPGDFVTVDLGPEKALVVRDEAGALHAFRNHCGYRSHRLVSAPRGHLKAIIECPIHGPICDLRGKAAGPPGTYGLSGLPLRQQDGLVWLRMGAGGAHEHLAGMLESVAANSVVVAGDITERVVAADWQRVIEHWLEFELPEQPLGRLTGLLADPELHIDQPSGRMAWRARLESGGRSWFARRYASLAGATHSAGGAVWRREFLPPNQFIEVREEGLSVLQVLGLAAGQSRVRWLEYHSALDTPRLRAMAYLAHRLRGTWLAQDLEATAALQGEQLSPFARAALEMPPVCTAVAAFRASLSPG